MELRLKKGEDRRLRAGHAWVFSNEVDIALTPLTAFRPGDAVRVISDRGTFLGHAYVNPHALICARLLSRDERCEPDAALFGLPGRMQMVGRRMPIPSKKPRLE